MSKNISTARENILSIACALFYCNGYNSTGFAQIAAQAGVTETCIYELFGSKEELCIACLNRRHTYWFNKLIEFIDEAETPKSKMVASFDFLYQMNIEEDFRGCSFLNIMPEVTVRNQGVLAVIQNHKKELRDFFKGQLKGQKQYIIDHVYLLFESAIIESQLFRSQWPVESSRQLIHSLVK